MQFLQVMAAVGVSIKIGQALMHAVFAVVGSMYIFVYNSADQHTI